MFHVYLIHFWCSYRHWLWFILSMLMCLQAVWLQMRRNARKLSESSLHELELKQRETQMFFLGSLPWDRVNVVFFHMAQAVFSKHPFFLPSHLLSPYLTDYKEAEKQNWAGWGWLWMATIQEQRPGVCCCLRSEYADFSGEPQGVLHVVGEWLGTTIDVFCRSKLEDWNRG